MEDFNNLLDEYERNQQRRIDEFNEKVAEAFSELRKELKENFK